jgi:hypothetical protein
VCAAFEVHDSVEIAPWVNRLNMGARAGCAMARTDPPPPNAPAPAESVAEATDRRRQGRQDFTNPSLIAVMRDPAADPAPDAPPDPAPPLLAQVADERFLEGDVSPPLKYPAIYLLLVTSVFWSLVTWAVRRWRHWG